PSAKMQQAIAAVDKALEAEPKDSRGLTKKAFAHFFTASFLQYQGDPKPLLPFLEQFAAVGAQAVAAHPDDAYAHELLGLAYRMRGEASVNDKPRAAALFQDAISQFNIAIKINDKFVWAYGDLGATYIIKGAQKFASFEDPTEDLQK